MADTATLQATTPLATMDYIHSLTYGDSGCGKTHLWATAPTPTLIALFDSIGNARPYLRGLRNRMTRELGAVVNGKPTIINTILCYAMEDTALTTPLRKIWCFATEGPTLPVGKLQFDTKLAILQQEIDTFGAKTFIFDTVTQYHTMSRLAARFFNPNPSQGERDWAYAATDSLEQVAMILMGLRCNVGMLAHVSDVVDGKGRRTTAVNAPGRLQRNLLSMFSDSWFVYTDDEGHHRVQLVSKGDYRAKNTLGLTDDTVNDWTAIVGSQPEDNQILWV